MSNIDIILNCDDLEKTIDDLIYKTRRISPPIIGIVSYDMKHKPVFGFISNETKVYISNYSDVYYRIYNNSYLYAFFRTIKRRGLTNINEIINEIPAFLNWYLGSLSKTDNRITFLENAVDINSSLTSDELASKIHNIDINIFFESEEATSIERSIITEQILSLLEVPSYLVIGVLQNGLEEETPHAFNIANIDGVNKLIDTSYTTYDEDRIVPFMYDINQEEEKDFLAGKIIKYAPEYVFITKEDGSKTKIIRDSFRLYRAVYPTLGKKRRR